VDYRKTFARLFVVDLVIPDERSLHTLVVDMWWNRRRHYDLYTGGAAKPYGSLLSTQREGGPQPAAWWRNSHTSSASFSGGGWKNNPARNTAALKHPR